MGVHAAKGELLAALFAGSFECIVRKLLFVAVVVDFFYAVFGGELLKGMFGFERLLSWEVQHQMDEPEVGVVIHKMVAPVYRFLVSLPFNCAKKPTCVDSIWSMEAHFPGLVATKTLWEDFDSLPCQESLVIAPKRQPANFGGTTLANFLGILPLSAMS
jgi:hypothetical protein